MFSLGYPREAQGFPKENVSQFGPAILPAIPDIHIYIYMNEEHYYMIVLEHHNLLLLFYLMFLKYDMKLRGQSLQAKI